MIDHVGVIARKLSEVDYVTIGAKLEKTIADVNSIVVGKVDPMLGEAKDFIAELRASNAELNSLLKSEEIARTLANIDAISADVRGIVGDGSTDLKAGIAEFPKLMKGASDAAERLDEILKSRRIDEILASLEKTSGELPPTVAEYRAVGQQLQQFLASESHEIRQLIEALRQTAENLEQVTGSARNDLGQTIFGAPPPRVAPGQPVPGGAR
jgi:ABC-type transporter Mla subunit MlaD